MTALLALAAFASTNIDDLALLLGIMARRDHRPSAILGGQLLATAVLTGASAAVASLDIVIPASTFRLLGFVPIVIGVGTIWRGAAPVPTGPQPRKERGGIVAVAALTIANGGDNIAATVPLMAGRPAADLVTIGVVYAAMTVVWFGLARSLVAHPRLGAPTCQRAGAVFPYGLIGLGLLILISR